MTCDYLASCISFTSHFHFCLYSTCTDVTTEICISVLLLTEVCSPISEHPPHSVHQRNQKSGVEVAATHVGVEVACVGALSDPPFNWKGPKRFRRNVAGRLRM